MSRRVVATGIGLLSCLGHDLATVERSLRTGRSGVHVVPAWADAGLPSPIGGLPAGVDDRLAAAAFPRTIGLAMSNVGSWCALAAVDAVADAGLDSEALTDQRTGCLVGSGAGDYVAIHEAATLFDEGKTRRAHPLTVLRAMSSSPSAAVSNLLGIRGRSYSISSACATAAHNIGHAYELIRTGYLDRAVAGGGEHTNTLMAAGFSTLRLALSTGFNDEPERASRPFDADRDGFVLGGGAAIVVLEAAEVAAMRRVEPLCEIAGFGASSDAFDLVVPDAEGAGAAACMTAALVDAGLEPGEVDYLNAHGTSTPIGDVAELAAIRRVFGDTPPRFSSTKSTTGHGLGAAGGLELAFCIAMMRGGFIAPSINVDRPDPAVANLPLVTEACDARIDVAMSNSFGFGGTNAVLVLRRTS